MHGVFVVHVRLSTCVGIRRTSIRVSRFAIATCNPSCPLFPVRCVQFPCPTNNPIYTPDYSGNRGRFSTLSLPRLPGLLPLSDLLEPPLPTCLRWLNRHGRFEGACPRQRFDRAASIQTWLIVTFFLSSLDQTTV